MEGTDVEQFDVAGIARVTHEAMRGLQQVLGDPHPAPPFDEVTPEMVASIVEGIRLVMMHDVTPEELHQNWVDHHREQGWTYGPVKDAAAKRHPSLVPWNQLPDTERRKDVLFMAIVDALVRPLDDEEELREP